METRALLGSDSNLQQWTGKLRTASKRMSLFSRCKGKESGAELSRRRKVASKTEGGRQKNTGLARAMPAPPASFLARPPPPTSTKTTQAKAAEEAPGLEGLCSLGLIVFGGLLCRWVLLIWPFILIISPVEPRSLAAQEARLRALDQASEGSAAARLLEKSSHGHVGG
jgi:hypothetical protein